MHMQVVEVRGGSVQVEAGGEGATFVGVTFLALKHTPQDTQVRHTQSTHSILTPTRTHPASSSQGVLPRRHHILVCE